MIRAAKIFYFRCQALRFAGGLRLSAIDYEGVHWNGAWTHFSELDVVGSKMGDCVVQGAVSQISTMEEGRNFTSENGSTELVYSNPPYLPLGKINCRQRSFESSKMIDGFRYQSRDIYLGEQKVSFIDDEESGLFRVCAEHGGIVKATYIEAQIPYALAFISGRFCFPRAVIRRIGGRAHFFLRMDKNEKSGFPPPVVGNYQDNKVLWNIFECCIRYLAERDFWDPPLFIRQILEIIATSTGSAHSFIASIAIAVENLAVIVASEYKIQLPKEESRMELMNHLKSWNGEEDLKNRAVGLLGMLNDIPVKMILRTLLEAKVIEKKHFNAWKTIRPKVAHGHLYDMDLSAEDWQNRNLLISMVHRLTLRIIGYRGFVSEYSENPPNLKEFQWL